MTDFCSTRDLADQVSDGDKIALPPDYSGCAMEVAKDLIRAQRRNLHIVGVPTLGLQSDWLIGAGCVDTVETAAVTLGEHGLAPRFSDAIKHGTIRIIDATCPAIHAALQAAEKGIPFMPVRGIIGSDLDHFRDDWKTINNPFAEDEPIIVVPAIVPDLAIFHVSVADRDGNAFVGVRRELMVMAHAAKRTLITAEEIVDDNLMQDPLRAAGTIPGLYIDAVAPAKQGAYPIGMWGGYGPESQAIGDYVTAAKTQAGFDAYMAALLADQPTRLAS